MAAVTTVVFQRLLNRKEGQTWIPFAWAAADMVVLEALLLNATSDGVTDQAIDTPFLVAFPVLIAAAGLWFRVAVVWFTTALSVLAYAGLLAYHLIESGITIRAPHQQVIFAEPSRRFQTFLTPNDQYYNPNDLWGLFKAQAANAWNTAAGLGVVVAVVDTLGGVVKLAAVSPFTNPP